MARYWHHFGLERDPFLDTADPHFAFETPALRRDIARLTGSVEESLGLAVVAGPAGVGKTTVSTIVEHVLIRQDRMLVGKILDPSFSTADELLTAVARVFGLPLGNRSTASAKNALKNYLFDMVMLEQRTPVLLVDEAQLLPASGLDEIRLLLNFETPERKLLNVVLFGRSEIEAQIAQRDGFADRVATWVRLGPLDTDEIAALIDYRITRAGGRSRLFSADARSGIVTASNGVPRRGGRVARSAMIEASERGSDTVFDDHVAAAVRTLGATMEERTPGTRADDRGAANPLGRLFVRRSNA